MGVSLRSGWWCVACSVVLIALVGTVDFLTDVRVNCATLYLLPILWVTWCMGWWPGICASLASIGVWILSDMVDRSVSLPWRLMAWDTLMRAGVYITVASVMAALKESRDRESELARTDPVTEVANARSFREVAAVELERARRYKRPLTLAFIDVDNFKAINDKYGHDVGDILLRELAAAIKANIRSTDAVARVGGDEFVVLLPETDGQPARELLDRIRKVVHDVVRRNGTPMTLSVGAVTFTTVPGSVDEIIKRADDLMYDVKRRGKDGVAHAVYSSDAPPAPAGQAGPAAKA